MSEEIKMVPTGNSTFHQILDIKLKAFKKELLEELAKMLKPAKKDRE